MLGIARSQVASFLNVGSKPFPKVVDVHCPHCGRHVSLTIENWPTHANGWSHTTSRCPACNGRTYFHAFKAAGIKNAEGPFVDLWLYPAPNVRRPRVDLSSVEEASEGLQRAYESAVNVVNSGEWNAAATMCRRVLEGITKSLLDDSHRTKPLYAQIQALPETRDLGAPILTLADSIREGGNLGAHFDLDEREADEETAKMMLTLLEDLLEFLFVLPSEIKRLQEKLDTSP